MNREFKLRCMINNPAITTTCHLKPLNQKRINKTTTYDVGNPDSGLEQTERSSGVNVPFLKYIEEIFTNKQK